jgi:hypothetical protein
MIFNLNSKLVIGRLVRSFEKQKQRIHNTIYTRRQQCSSNRSCAARILRMRRMTAWRQKKRGRMGPRSGPISPFYKQNEHVTLSESTLGTRVDESKGNCSSLFAEKGLEESCIAATSSYLHSSDILSDLE